MMNFLDHHDILENTDAKTIIKGKHKDTEELCVFESISCKHLGLNERKSLIKKIEARESICHPNVLKFFGYFDTNETIYIKQEFCHYGSLRNVMEIECLRGNKIIHEELLCRILYHIVFALKTVECFMGDLCLDTVFLDADFNAKLYNFYKFQNPGHKKQKEIKMSQLGVMMFELCTLKQFLDSTYEAELEKSSYTAGFKSLLVSIIKDKTEMKKHINKVLCNSTLLLMSTQWSKNKCFMDNSEIDTNQEVSSQYQLKLEKLRKKEACLHLKEQLLKERERKLENKEKKLHLMERTLKEKLQQAELYLKRSRENCRSVSSGSSKSSIQSQTESKKMSLEELDSTYVSCGDSVVLPTSTKLEVNKIIKPQNFSRTLSERRIRFKTSPLKEKCLNRKSASRKSLLRHSMQIFDENADKENLRDIFLDLGNRKFPGKTIENQLYENDELVVNQTDVFKKPCEVSNIGWTEESKKQAFEMLRSMNSLNMEKDEIKHTQL